MYTIAVGGCSELDPGDGNRLSFCQRRERVGKLFLAPFPPRRPSLRISWVVMMGGIRKLVMGLRRTYMYDMWSTTVYRVVLLIHQRIRGIDWELGVLETSH